MNGHSSRDHHSTIRVFLDNNVWNGLASGSSPVSGEDLVAAYRRHQIEVIGTLELFEEILATTYSSPARYSRMKRLFLRLVSDRILLPLNIRHVKELEGGGLLTVDERYLPRGVRRRIELQLTPRAPLSRSLADEIHSRKYTGIQTDREMRDEVLSRITEMGKRPNDFERSVAESTVREAVHGMVEAGLGRGFNVVPFDEISFQRLPSAWLLAGATAARLTRTAGEGRSVKPSDQHDRLHASTAAYCDILITDDREFRATIDLIPDFPAEVLTSDAFAQRLATLS
jgi:hypothetical protein